MNTVLKNGSRFNLLPMNAFSREMSRWVNELSGDVGMASDAGVVGQTPVSIWESDTSFHFQFDLPGVSPDDVDLKIIENTLHLTASRTPPADMMMMRQERRFGSIERQFLLPARVDANQVQASLESGVLTVTVAKAPEAQVQKIAIKST